MQDQETHQEAAYCIIKMAELHRKEKLKEAQELERFRARGGVCQPRPLQQELVSMD